MFPILLLLHPASAGPWNQEPNIHHLLSRVTPSPFHELIHTHHAVPGSCTCLWLTGFLFHWTALIRSLLCSSYVWTSDTLFDPLRSKDDFMLRWIPRFKTFVLCFKGWQHFLGRVQSSWDAEINDLESGSERMMALMFVQGWNTRWTPWHRRLECKLGINSLLNYKWSLFIPNQQFSTWSS